MPVFLRTLLAVLPSILRSRAAVELENLALRHQIGVLQRCAAKRPKLTPGDRLFWICLSRLWRDWRSALAIVKPATVLAWHHAAFRRFWTWKVRRGLPGRPVISREVRDLIRKMCRRIPFGVHPASMANCSHLASTSPKAASANTWRAETNRPLRLGALNRPMKDKVCSCLVCSCLVCSSALLVFFSSFPEFEFNSFSLLLFPFLRGGSCVCFSPPVRCHLNPSFFERRAASEK